MRSTKLATKAALSMNRTDCGTPVFTAVKPASRAARPDARHSSGVLPPAPV